MSAVASTKRVRLPELKRNPRNRPLFHLVLQEYTNQFGQLIQKMMCADRLCRLRWGHWFYPGQLKHSERIIAVAEKFDILAIALHSLLRILHMCTILVPYRMRILQVS